MEFTEQELEHVERLVEKLVALKLKETPNLQIENFAPGLYRKFLVQLGLLKEGKFQEADIDCGREINNGL